MGITCSSNRSSSIMDADEYLKHLCNLAGGNVNTTRGGGNSVIGGYNSLTDYGNSMFAEAKEALIRGIAKDVSSIFKLQLTLLRLQT